VILSMAAAYGALRFQLSSGFIRFKPHQTLSNPTMLVRTSDCVPLLRTRAVYQFEILPPFAKFSGQNANYC